MIGLSWRGNSTTAIELVFILKNGVHVASRRYLSKMCMYACMFEDIFDCSMMCFPSGRFYVRVHFIIEIGIYHVSLLYTSYIFNVCHVF